MITVEDLIRIMWIVIPIVLGVTVTGFIVFVRWGRGEKEKNRIQPPKGL